MDTQPFDSEAFAWYLTEASMYLTLFAQYLETLETFLDAEVQKYEHDLVQLRASGQIRVDPEMGPETTFPGHMLDLIGGFEETLRGSFFVSLYDFLEYTLTEECRSRKRSDRTIRLKVSDLRGEGVDRVKRFFEVLGLDFPSNTSEWGEIQNYKTLRNCVVHARGRVDKLKSPSEQAKLRAFVAREKLLSIDENEYSAEVILEKGFCERALATIERFLHSWYTQKT